MSVRFSIIEDPIKILIENNRNSEMYSSLLHLLKHQLNHFQNKKGRN